MLNLFLHRHHHDPKERTLILELAHWVLTNNLIEFNNEYYIQLSGTAMGTPFAVTYACIYLAQLEHELNTTMTTIQHNDPTYQPPILLKRFIDDIFGIFPDTHSALTYLNEYKKLRPNHIKLTHDISTQHCNVLDLHLYKKEDFQETDYIQTSIYHKPHNKFLFIPPYSYHHNNASWIHSYVNRIQLICSETEQFNKCAQNFFTQLLERGYTAEYLRPIFIPKPRSTLLRQAQHRNTTPQQRTQKRAPLILKLQATPRTLGAKKDLARLLRFTQAGLIDPALRKIANGKMGPVFCYTRSINLSGMLTRAKLPKPKPA